MTAHKHAEMIKAKADNMDLVKFIRVNGEWVVDNLGSCHFDDACEYFLCLPQHKGACLHWLNDGDVLVKSKFVPSWDAVHHGQVWGSTIGWMREDAQYRIKPRKEKRWIGFSSKSNIVTGMSFSTRESLSEYVSQNFAYPEYIQAIEIEVEV